MKMFGHYRRALYFTLCAFIAWRRAARSPGAVDIAKQVRFIGIPIMSCAEGASISIGPRSVLCSNSRYTDLGVSKPVIIRALNRGARLSVGADCGLSGTTICAADSVVIEDGCLIGSDVTIVDTDFHPVEPVQRRYEKEPSLIGIAPVHIGPNVFVGAGSVILKGVTIGANAVVGAGSVVTKDVPANSVVGGNPAKVLRHLNNQVASVCKGSSR